MTDMITHQKNSEQGNPSRNFLFRIRKRKMKSAVRMKKNDFILILALLLFSVSITISFRMTGSVGSVVTVTVNGEAFGSYPLNRDTTVEIRTGEQENFLVIENGEAFVRSANCSNGRCCAHRPISREGEIIACYPHNVIIAVCTE